MCNLGWGGGDGRPPLVQCPECGRTVRGLKDHLVDKHGHKRRRRKKATVQFYPAFKEALLAAGEGATTVIVDTTPKD